MDKKIMNLCKLDAIEAEGNESKAIVAKIVDFKLKIRGVRRNFRRGLPPTVDPRSGGLGAQLLRPQKLMDILKHSGLILQYSVCLSTLRLYLGLYKDCRW